MFTLCQLEQHEMFIIEVAYAAQYKRVCAFVKGGVSKK
jgi:hypothetical protein